MHVSFSNEYEVDQWQQDQQSHGFLLVLTSQDLTTLVVMQRPLPKHKGVCSNFLLSFKNEILN